MKQPVEFSFGNQVISTFSVQRFKRLSRFVCGLKLQNKKEFADKRNLIPSSISSCFFHKNLAIDVRWRNGNITAKKSKKKQFDRTVILETVTFLSLNSLRQHFSNLSQLLADGFLLN